MTRKQALAIDSVLLTLSITYMINSYMNASIYLAVIAILLSLLNTFHMDKETFYIFIGLILFQSILVFSTGLYRMYPSIFLTEAANGLFCLSFLDYYDASKRLIQRQLDHLMIRFICLFLAFVLLWFIVVGIFPDEFFTTGISLLASILLMFGPLTISYCFKKKIS